MCKATDVNHCPAYLTSLFSPLQPISSNNDDDDDNEAQDRSGKEPRDDRHTIFLNVDIDATAKDGPSPLGRLCPPAGPERRVAGLGG